MGQFGTDFDPAVGMYACRFSSGPVVVTSQFVPANSSTEVKCTVPAWPSGLGDVQLELLSSNGVVAKASDGIFLYRFEGAQERWGAA